MANENVLKGLQIIVTDLAQQADGHVLQSRIFANEGFTKLGKKNIEAAEQARFKVLNDNNGLWFFWDCVDGSIKTEARPLDDSIWHDDCIELFFSTSPDISPDRNIREYYQIIVNPSGSVFDAFNRGGAADTQWTSMTKAVGKLKDGGWQLISWGE